MNLRLPFLILDPEGELILSQNTEFLEKGYSYDEKRMVDFLTEWAHRDAPPPQPATVEETQTAGKAPDQPPVETTAAAEPSS